MWSAAYVAEYLEALQGPYSELRFSFESEEGLVTVIGSNVHVDLRMGAVFAEHVQVIDALNLSAFTANSVEIKAPLPWLRNPKWEAVVKGGVIFVERGMDGKYSWERLLPKITDEEAPEIPFEVRLERAVIYYTDLQNENTHWTIDARGISFEGIGEKWRLIFDGNISEVGELYAIFVSDESGVIQTQLRSGGAELAALRKYFAKLPELSNEDIVSFWDAEQAYFSGSLTARKQKDETWSFRGIADIDTKNLRLFERDFAQASFAGSFQENYINGRFLLSGSGYFADAVGVIAWRPDVKTSLKGKMQVSNERIAKSFLKKDYSLPNELSFSDAFYDGLIEYDKAWVLSGDLKTKRLGYGDYFAKDVNTKIVSNGRQVRFHDIEANVFESDVKGVVVLSLDKGNELAGRLHAKSLGFDKIEAIKDQDVLSGDLDVAVILSGSIDQPVYAVNAHGNVTARLHYENKKFENVFRITSRLEGGAEKLKIVSFVAEGEPGVFTGNGTFNISAGELNLEIFAHALDVNEFFTGEELEGTIFGKATIGGKLDNLSADARVEVYSAQYNSWQLPFAYVDLSLRGQTLLVPELFLQSGVTLLRGGGEISLQDKTLSGHGSIMDVSFSEVTDNVVQGLLSGNWALAGSFDEPLLSADVSGEQIFVDRIPLSNARITASVDKHGIVLENLFASVGMGMVTATGSFPYESHGALRMIAEDIPADIFLDYLGADAIPSGDIQAELLVNVFDFALADATLDVSLSNIAINDEYLGGGFVNAKYKEGDLLASIEFGSLQGFYILENGYYNFDSKEIRAEISALNADIPTLVRVANKNLRKNLQPETVDEINNIFGSLSLNAKVGNVLEDPNIAVSLNSRDLSYRETLTPEGRLRELGELYFEARREHKIWEISKSELIGGPVVFRLLENEKNYFVENGDIELNGEISKADLSMITMWIPELKELSGSLYVPFIVRGESRSPEIIASVNARDLRYGEFATDGLNIDAIYIKDGAIQTDDFEGKKGSLYVRGFAADLMHAHIPFRYPFEIPDDEEVLIHVAVPARDINALSAFFGGLDDQYTKGTFLGGDFRLGGTLSEPSVSGSLAVEAESLKFEDIESIIRLHRAQIDLNEGLVLNWKVSASGMQSGEFLSEGGVDLSAKSVLAGSFISANEFPLYFSFPGDTYFRSNLTAENIGISGSWNDILISDSDPALGKGSIVLRESFLNVGDALPEREITEKLPVEVTFNLSNIDIRDLRVSSGPLLATFNGSASVQRTLSEPEIRAPFIVESGRISLPSGDVNLERGGIATFAYSSSWLGEPSASLRLELPANTRIFAFNGLNVQKYDVNLFISGDLFDERDLFIDAQSDPPGLSRDEILGFLGQRQLLESLGSAFAVGFETQLTGIITAAAPGLLSPFTRALEEGLGLDYVMFDLGVYGRPAIILGKEVGGGFTIELRRLLSNTREELPQEYDQINLVFRPRTRNPLLNRFSFSFGVDSSGLWRTSAGYSIRF